MLRERTEAICKDGGLHKRVRVFFFVLMSGAANSPFEHFANLRVFFSNKDLVLYIFSAVFKKTKDEEN
jgi:hypothetical protein